MKLIDELPRDGRGHLAKASRLLASKVVTVEDAVLFVRIAREHLVADGAADARLAVWDALSDRLAWCWDRDPREAQNLCEAAYRELAPDQGRRNQVVLAAGSLILSAVLRAARQRARAAARADTASQPAGRAS